MSRQPSTPPIRLVHDGHLLHLRPLDPDRRTELVRALAGPTDPPALLWPDGDGATTFAGLADAVTEWLTGQCHPVVDDRPDTADDWGPPGPGLADRFHPLFTDVAALDLVRQHPRGWVRTDSRRGSTRLVAQVAAAYPGRRLVVLVNDRRRVGRVRRRLSRFGVPVVSRAGLALPAAGPAVAVITPDAATTALAGADLVVVLDPDELAAGPRPRLLAVLRAAATARLVAVAPDYPENPDERLLLESVFAATTLISPGYGLVRRPVSLEVLRLTGTPAPAAVDPEGLKRDGIIMSRTRNRQLARRATAEADAGWRVVVLADDADHAGELGRLLPAAVAVGVDEWMPVGLRATGTAAYAPGPDYGLVVATARALVRIPAPDVLVRADGGSGLPPLPPAWTACHPAGVAPLRVIDTDDRHHPDLRQKALARMTAARRAGWPVIGDPPDTPLGRLARLHEEGAEQTAG